MSSVKVNHSEAYQKALAHVIQHAEFNEDTIEFVDYVTNKKGNVVFCTRRLRSYAEANAMVSWFRDSDLIAFKQWCFIAAKLNRMVIQFDGSPPTNIYMLYYQIMKRSFLGMLNIDCLMIDKAQLKTVIIHENQTFMVIN